MEIEHRNSPSSPTEEKFRKMLFLMLIFLIGCHEAAPTASIASIGDKQEMKKFGTRNRSAALLWRTLLLKTPKL